MIGQLNGASGSWRASRIRIPAGCSVYQFLPTGQKVRFTENDIPCRSSLPIWLCHAQTGELMPALDCWREIPISPNNAADDPLGNSQMAPRAMEAFRQGPV